MTTDGPVARRRPGLVGGLIVLVALAILIGLGLWQVKRLHWKEQLLAHVAALRTAPARPLLAVLAAAGDRDYARVAFDCPSLERTPTLRLYALQSGQTGYRLITACSVAGPGFDTVLVDRGFVGLDQAGRVGPGRNRLAQPVIGVLRAGGGRNLFTPPDQPTQNLWYARDADAMARALGAGRPASMFVMLEQPAPVGLGPVPSATPLDIPNRHLDYALTWFGLAAALVGVYVAMLLGKRSV